MTAPSHLAVTGACGSLGRRVVARAERDHEVERILASDLAPAEPAGPKVSSVVVDLVRDDLGLLVEQADIVVHLAFRVGAHGDAARANVEGTRRLLDAAASAAVGHVVLLSSATVYGAWPENPVPLGEDRPVRPNPDAGYAMQKAEVERLAGEWVRRTGATASVLRPAVSVAGDDWTWLARALGLVPGFRGVEDPPFQLLHLDDLAAAVDLARRRRLDGPYNVAPDGWLSGSEALALAGEPPRLRLPEWALRRLASLSWEWRVGRRPPGLVPYRLHPWVVANDRLRAAGWEPAHTNDENLVDATPGTPWSRLTPKRRQELALGGASVAAAGAAGAAVRMARRTRRRAG